MDSSVRRGGHGGRIGRISSESTPWFEPRLSAPAGSPNVLFVVLDDVGFADFGCYGSEIRTPHIDGLAARGLRYSNFHTTTLCSSTRACLLTGRNHHSVGMRYLANFDMGWPSGRGAISPRAATIAEVLRDGGWGTYAVGKWHVAPTDECSAAGPFDHWPLSRGFDRFYGFMNGGTGQFNPELMEDNHPVRGLGGADSGYHLSADLVDQAIAMLSTQLSLLPDKPFFMNLALGAGHWPHQVPSAWMQRYDGMYEAGWDVMRQARLDRQKAMGLVPASTQLPPSNPGVMPWAQLARHEQQVAVRLQQAYAAFLEHADEQLGRLVAFLERTGRIDNTLVVLLSDNGASTDCLPGGTTNILRWFNGLPEGIEDQLADYDLIGTARSNCNYPWGWAQMSNTPTRLYKGNTHGGGVRDPLIVSWPRRITRQGEIRHQFHHAIDLMPTVLEVCGVEAPAAYRGVEQLPVHGTSLAYTFDEADAATRKEVQYFEMYGHRGIWHRGWKAVTCHQPGTSFEDERWELYRLDDDFAETHDLSAEQPARLREMVERWWAEAGKYDVMPLDDRRDLLFRPTPKPGSIRAQRRFVLLPGIPAIPAESAPMVADVSHRIQLHVDMAAEDGGMLLCFGDAAGGYALYLENRRLVYVYNRCGELSVMRSTSLVRAGRHVLTFEFTKTGHLKGVGRLLLDGVSDGEMAFDGLLRRPTLGSLHVGRSSMPPMTEEAGAKADFSGQLHQVVFEIGDDGSTGELQPVD